MTDEVMKAIVDVGAAFKTARDAMPADPKRCECKHPVLSCVRVWLLRFPGGAYRCYTCNGYRRRRR